MNTVETANGYFQHRGPCPVKCSVGFHSGLSEGAASTVRLKICSREGTLQMDPDTESGLDLRGC